jgi:hypothetical protein
MVSAGMVSDFVFAGMVSAGMVSDFVFAGMVSGGMVSDLVFLFRNPIRLTKNKAWHLE